MDGERVAKPRCTGILPAALTAGVLFLQGCLGAPDTPRTGTFEWQTYRNESMGVSLEYPDAYQLDEGDVGTDVAFRLAGAPAIRLTLRTEQDARRHGLWAAHEPVADVTLAGVDGKRYEYDHYDGPFGSPVLAYVIPYKGKYLALEFRTTNSEPDEVQRRMLASVRVES